jgi:hypothetical protein
MTTSPTTTQTRVMPLAALLLLSLATVLAIAWFFAALGYWEDDAYIHLEFARSLATGHGFQFNGHLVYGDTSPLWVWLLVFAHTGFANTPAAWLASGKLLTVLAAVISLTGVFFFAHSLVTAGIRHALPPAKANLFAAWMVLIFVLSPYFGYWAFSGMEALAACGLAAWTCVLLTHHRHSWRRILVAALLGGLAPLLRPEMAFFTLLLVFILSARIRHLRASLTLRIDLLVASLVLLAAPAIAWAVYAQHIFGSALPNTNAAKRAAPNHSVLLRLLHLYGFGYLVTLLACLLFAGWLLWHLAKDRSALSPNHLLYRLPRTGWLVLLWTLLNCGFYLGNHTFVQTRYIFPSAQLLTIAVLALAAVRWPGTYRCLLVATLLFETLSSALSTLPMVRNKIIVDATYAQLAGTLRNLPPDAPVALYAIGEPAFLSGHPVIDTGGITRPGAIPYIFDPTSDRTTAWAIREGAQYEVIDHSPLPGSKLIWSRDLPVTGWLLTPRHHYDPDKLQLWQLPETFH